MSVDYVQAMLTNLTDDERGQWRSGASSKMIFPRAPRLDPLRAALGKFEAAGEPTAHPTASPPAKADKAGAAITGAILRAGST
jgi:hypothetical protein